MPYQHNSFQGDHPELVPASAVLPSMLAKMNFRQRPGAVPASPTRTAPKDRDNRTVMRGGGAGGLNSRSSMALNGSGAGGEHSRARSMTGSLRGFRLQESVRIAPTF
jgi:hypothetical protein